jgi:HK97 family phage prohead protease
MATRLAPEKIAEIRDRVLASETEKPASRSVAFHDIELREEDGKLQFTGHAAVFDRLSEDLGGFREKIQRGAFRKVLEAEPDVRFLFDHAGQPMARSTINSGPGTLDLREDPKGLRVYAELVPTTQAQDLRLLVKTGVVSQMSFGFRIRPNGSDVWEEVDGELVRTIVSFGELFDVSAVTFPAYPQTDAAMRSRVLGVNIIESGEVLEPALRDLAWKIHRGDLTASVEERAAIDAAYARTSTVSPWMAQRALMAASQEPELQGVIQGKRATVVLEDAESGDQDATVAFRLAARKRRLRAHTNVREEKTT